MSSIGEVRQAQSSFIPEIVRLGRAEMEEIAAQTSQFDEEIKALEVKIKNAGYQVMSYAEFVASARYVYNPRSYVERVTAEDTKDFNTQFANHVFSDSLKRINTAFNFKENLGSFSLADLKSDIDFFRLRMLYAKKAIENNAIPNFRYYLADHQIQFDYWTDYLNALEAMINQDYEKAKVLFNDLIKKYGENYSLLEPKPDRAEDAAVKEPEPKSIFIKEPEQKSTFQRFVENMGILHGADVPEYTYDDIEPIVEPEKDVYYDLKEVNHYIDRVYGSGYNFKEEILKIYLILIDICLAQENLASSYEDKNKFLQDAANYMDLAKKFLENIPKTEGQGFYESPTFFDDAKTTIRPRSYLILQERIRNLESAIAMGKDSLAALASDNIKFVVDNLNKRHSTNLSLADATYSKLRDLERIEMAKFKELPHNLDQERANLFYRTYLNAVQEKLKLAELAYKREEYKIAENLIQEANRVSGEFRRKYISVKGAPTYRKIEISWNEHNILKGPDSNLREVHTRDRSINYDPQLILKAKYDDSITLPEAKEDPKRTVTIENALISSLDSETGISGLEGKKVMFEYPQFFTSFNEPYIYGRRHAMGEIAAVEKTTDNKYKVSIEFYYQGYVDYEDSVKYIENGILRVVQDREAAKRTISFELDLENLDMSGVKITIPNTYHFYRTGSSAQYDYTRELEKPIEWPYYGFKFAVLDYFQDEEASPYYYALSKDYPRLNETKIPMAEGALYIETPLDPQQTDYILPDRVAVQSAILGNAGLPAFELEYLIYGSYLRNSLEVAKRKDNYQEELVKLSKVADEIIAKQTDIYRKIPGKEFLAIFNSSTRAREVLFQIRDLFLDAGWPENFANFKPEEIEAFFNSTDLLIKHGVSAGKVSSLYADGISDFVLDDLQPYFYRPALNPEGHSVKRSMFPVFVDAYLTKAELARINKDFSLAFSFIQQAQKIADAIPGNEADFKGVDPAIISSYKIDSLKATLYLSMVAEDRAIIQSNANKALTIYVKLKNKLQNLDIVLPSYMQRDRELAKINLSTASAKIILASLEYKTNTKLGLVKDVSALLQDYDSFTTEQNQGKISRILVEQMNLQLDIAKTSNLLAEAQANYDPFEQARFLSEAENMYNGVKKTYNDLMATDQSINQAYDKPTISEFWQTMFLSNVMAIKNIALNANMSADSFDIALRIINSLEEDALNLGDGLEKERVLFDLKISKAYVYFARAQSTDPANIKNAFENMSKSFGLAWQVMAETARNRNHSDDQKKLMYRKRFLEARFLEMYLFAEMKNKEYDFSSLSLKHPRKDMLAKLKTVDQKFFNSLLAEIQSLSYVSDAEKNLVRANYYASNASFCQSLGAPDLALQQLENINFNAETLNPLVARLAIETTINAIFEANSGNATQKAVNLLAGLIKKEDFNAMLVNVKNRGRGGEKQIQDMIKMSFPDVDKVLSAIKNMSTDYASIFSANITQYRYWAMLYAKLVAVLGDRLNSDLRNEILNALAKAGKSLTEQQLAFAMKGIPTQAQRDLAETMLVDQLTDYGFASSIASDQAVLKASQILDGSKEYNSAIAIYLLGVLVENKVAYAKMLINQGLATEQKDAFEKLLQKIYNILKNPQKTLPSLVMATANFNTREINQLNVLKSNLLSDLNRPREASAAMTTVRRRPSATAQANDRAGAGLTISRGKALIASAKSSPSPSQTNSLRASLEAHLQILQNKESSLTNSQENLRVLLINILEMCLLLERIDSANTSFYRDIRQTLVDILLNSSKSQIKAFGLNIAASDVTSNLDLDSSFMAMLLKYEK